MTDFERCGLCVHGKLFINTMSTRYCNKPQSVYFTHTMELNHQPCEFFKSPFKHIKLMSWPEGMEKIRSDKDEKNEKERIS